MNIIKVNKIRRLALISMAFVAIGAGAETLTLSCGLLEKAVASLERSAPSSLELKGEAWAYDLISLRNLPASVTTLDMSELTVKGGIAAKNYYGKDTFGDGELPAYMLMGTSVETVILPASAISIGDGAFVGTPVRSVDLRNVRSIGANVFKGCSQLTDVKTAGIAVTEIPEGTFRDCKALTKVSIPPTVSSIGDHAFQNSGLTAIDLGNVKAIGEYAFAQCVNLAEISVNSGCGIGEGAFFGDPGLSASGVLTATAPLAFVGGGNDGDELRVESPVVKEGAFVSHKASKIIMGAGVAGIEDKAFAGMANVHTVDVSALGTDVPQISEGAFYKVDTPKVELLVAAGTIRHWESEPVWNEFDIQEKTTGGDEIGTGICEISVSKNGESILVNSAETISELCVYALDGALLSECNPGSESYAFEMPDSPEVVVVRVRSGNMIKIVKIIR